MSNTNKHFHDFAVGGAKRLTLSEARRFLYNAGSITSGSTTLMVKSYFGSSMTNDDRTLRFTSASGTEVGNVTKYGLWVCDSKVILSTNGGTGGSGNLGEVKKTTATFKKTGTSNKVYGNNEVVPVYSDIRFRSWSDGRYPLLIHMISSFVAGQDLGNSDNEASNCMLMVGQGSGKGDAMYGPCGQSHTLGLLYGPSYGTTSNAIPQYPIDFNIAGMHQFGSIQLKSAYIYAAVTQYGSPTMTAANFVNTFSSAKYYYNNIVTVSKNGSTGNKILINIDYSNIPSFANSSNSSNNYSYAINNVLIPIPYIMANIFFDQFLKSANSGKRLYPNFLYSSKTSGKYINTFSMNGANGGVRFYYNSSNYSNRYLTIKPTKIELRLEPNLSKIMIEQNVEPNNGYISFTNGLATSVKADAKISGGWGNSGCTVYVYNNGSSATYLYGSASGSETTTVTTYSGFNISSTSTQSVVKIYYPAYVNPSNPSNYPTSCITNDNVSCDHGTKFYTYWWFIDWNRANSSAYSFV